MFKVTSDHVYFTLIVCAHQELEQIATWFREEGLAPDSTKEAQLCLLWRDLQHTRSRLSGVTRDLEIHRSQHLAEMSEVSYYR